MIKTNSRADFMAKVLREFLPETIEIKTLDTEIEPLIPTFEFRFTNPGTRRTDYLALCNVLWYLGADIKTSDYNSVICAEV